jgi:hypothetical protein
LETCATKVGGCCFEKYSWCVTILTNSNARNAKRQATAPVFFTLPSVKVTHAREDFGLRWQLAEAKRSEDWSAAATPLFDCGPSFQSGVALRFPPQSKKIWLRLRRAVNFRGNCFIHVPRSIPG